MVSINFWQRYFYTKEKKGLLKKAATIKKLKYFELGYELKKQTDIVERQCWLLNKVYVFDQKEDNEDKLIKKGRWW